MSKKTVLTSVAGLSLFLLMQGSALAVPCAGVKNVITKQGRTLVMTPTPYDLGTKVETALECDIGEAKQDSVAENRALTVNTEAFFGFDDWKYDGKFETGSTRPSTLANFTWDAGKQFYSGTFTLNAAALQYDNLMFVFKSGAGTSLVAYLVDPASGGGEFSTPFVTPAFTLTGGATQKAISHISVYYQGEARGTPGSVPEPATATLFALGALGLVARRRKQVAKA